jgi:hypothetical protein
MHERPPRASTRGSGVITRTPIGDTLRGARVVARRAAPRTIARRKARRTVVERSGRLTQGTSTRLRTRPGRNQTASVASIWQSVVCPEREIIEAHN